MHVARMSHACSMYIAMYMVWPRRLHVPLIQFVHRHVHGDIHRYVSRHLSRHMCGHRCRYAYRHAHRWMTRGPWYRSVHRHVRITSVACACVWGHLCRICLNSTGLHHLYTHSHTHVCLLVCTHVCAHVRRTSTEPSCLISLGLWAQTTGMYAITGTHPYPHLSSHAHARAHAHAHAHGHAHVHSHDR